MPARRRNCPGIATRIRCSQHIDPPHAGQPSPRAARAPGRRLQGSSTPAASPWRLHGALCAAPARRSRAPLARGVRGSGARGRLPRERAQRGPARRARPDDLTEIRTHRRREGAAITGDRPHGAVRVLGRWSAQHVRCWSGRASVVTLDGALLARALCVTARALAMSARSAPARARVTGRRSGGIGGALSSPAGARRGLRT